MGEGGRVWCVIVLVEARRYSFLFLCRVKVISFLLSNLLMLYSTVLLGVQRRLARVARVPVRARERRSFLSRDDNSS